MNDEQFRQIKEWIALLNSRLSRLEGEMLATQGAIRGMILAQPDLYGTLLSVHKQIETITAVALPAPIDEAYLDGIQRATQCLTPSAADLKDAGRE